MQPDTAPTLTWRPIESAPKDGGFLVWSPSHPDWAMPVRADLYHGAMDRHSRGMQPSHLSFAHFTHWMPLPPPPSETAPQPTACTECERLAEALEDIAEHETDCPSMTATEAMEHTLSEIRDKARFALASHTVRLIDGESGK